MCPGAGRGRVGRGSGPASRMMAAGAVVIRSRRRAPRARPSSRRLAGAAVDSYFSRWSVVCRARRLRLGCLPPTGRGLSPQSCARQLKVWHIFFPLVIGGGSWVVRREPRRAVPGSCLGWWAWGAVWCLHHVRGSVGWERIVLAVGAPFDLFDDGAEESWGAIFHGNRPASRLRQAAPFTPGRPSTGALGVADGRLQGVVLLLVGLASIGLLIGLHLG